MSDHDILLRIGKDTEYLRLKLDDLHARLYENSDKIYSLERDNIKTKQTVKIGVGILTFVAGSAVSFIILTHI